VLPGAHAFGAACVEQWLPLNRACPPCLSVLFLHMRARMAACPFAENAAYQDQAHCRCETLQ